MKHFSFQIALNRTGIKSKIFVLIICICIILHLSLFPPECPEKCVRQACTADGECCHPQCLGSCTVPASDTACAACVHYFHQGRCVAECPPGTYKFEGWRCISAKLCSKVHLPDFDSFVIHGGECMSECPSGYMRTAPNRWVANHPDAGGNGATGWRFSYCRPDLGTSSTPCLSFHSNQQIIRAKTKNTTTTEKGRT